MVKYIDVEKVAFDLKFYKKSHLKRAFPVEVPVDFYVTELWRLMKPSLRNVWDMWGSVTNLSGYWVFFWFMAVIEREETLRYALEQGNITQKQFDKAYPDDRIFF